MTTHTLVRLVLASLLLALPACGGSDDDNGDGTENPPPGGMDAVTLSALQAQLFTPSCANSTSCHSGSAAGSGLNLEAPLHGKIVGQRSPQLPSRTLVVAGDADGSYLFEKISSDDPESGDRMPLGSRLPAATIERVRAWIEAGAAND